MMPGGDTMDQNILYYEMPGAVVPVLVLNLKTISPEKVSAISDSMEAVINRLIAVEHPETTTVEELLG